MSGKMPPQSDEEALGSGSLMTSSGHAPAEVATDDLLGLASPAVAPVAAASPAPSSSSWFGRKGNKNKSSSTADADMNITNGAPQAFDASSDFVSIDDDINALAAELTKGAMELETAKSMKLNDAYVSLETMRHANLEIELGQFDIRRCVQCVRDLSCSQRPSTPYSVTTRYKNKMFKHKLCLMCGSPTCTKHSDPSFKKSKVVICTECAPLFSLDFVVECVALGNEPSEESAKNQRHQINHIIDVYDRIQIMLEYSAQFIDEVAEKLEHTTKKEDKIGLSANSAGVMSGVAGVAAAAAFVTPAGPPLLIASLFFGGAAQMTSSGTKMVNYRSTPSKMAFRIISLYNLVKSILTVTTVLRDALLNDHIDLEKYVENMIKETEHAVLEMKTGFEDEEEENDLTDEDETVDEDWDDESSWSSFESGNGSVTSARSASVSMRSHACSLAKIDESSELGGNKGQNPKTSVSGFDNLFATDEDGKNGGKKTISKQEQSAIDEEKLKKAISEAEANLSKRKLRSKNEAPPTPEVANGTKVSPSKQEQIDELKKSDHFMEREDKIGKLARFYSRSSLTTTSLVGAAAATAMAGAALSLVHVVFEANALAATIKRIQAGSPSKRAKALRMIKEDLQNLPKTNVIAEQWEKYLEVLREKQTKGGTSELGQIAEHEDNSQIGDTEEDDLD